MHRYREFGLVSDADEALRRAFRDGLRRAGLSHEQFLDALAWYRDHTRPGLDEAVLKEAFTEFAAQRQWSPQLVESAVAVYDTIREDGAEAVADPPPSLAADRATLARSDDALRRDPAGYWRDAVLQDAVFEARERLEALAGPTAAKAIPPNLARERMREIEAMLHDSSGAGQRRYWSDPALREDYAKALAEVHGDGRATAAEAAEAVPSLATSEDVPVQVG
jgi:beta-galactosidase/beta-glucuronidase